MTLGKSNWMAAACMAALSCTASVYAQDSGAEGIVRISDGRGRTPVQPASFHGHGGSGYASPGYGDCPNGGCPNGYCHGGAHGLGCFQETYCKNSPDHGYSPPAKYPLHRRGVEYTSNFPSQWYGTPGASYVGAPMVYQPTDTTQLGYYYQHVPFWRPTVGMLPQRPIPSQWHTTAPTAYSTSFSSGYGGSYAFSPYGFGHGFGHGYGYGGCPCPNCQMPATNPTSTEQPTALPVDSASPKPTTSLPPSPRQFENSAESGHIRRAAFE